MAKTPADWTIGGKSVPTVIRPRRVPTLVVVPVYREQQIYVSITGYRLSTTYKKIIIIAGKSKISFFPSLLSFLKSAFIIFNIIQNMPPHYLYGRAEAVKIYFPQPMKWFAKESHYQRRSRAAIQVLQSSIFILNNKQRSQHVLEVALLFIFSRVNLVPSISVNLTEGTLNPNFLLYL